MYKDQVRMQSSPLPNNANDFGAAATPSPRRTAAIVELGPNVLTSDPRSGFSNTPRDATIQVTFTEPVSVDAGWFTLNCATTGAHASATFAESFGGQDHYITPNDNFTAGEVCTITILKDRIHDLDVDDSGPNTDTLPADYSWSFTVATGTAPPYTANVHATFGNPSAAGVDPLNYLMLKPEFTVSYNRDLGRPNWVSWHLSDDWTGSLTRVDTFRPDPQIPQDWYRVQSFDFVGSGFDRGHMTPNADRDKETSSPINQATFLMSNMVAQAPGNNQGPWASLEGYLRTLIDTEHDELYIVAGASGVGGVGSNGGVTNTLADGHVTVPAVTWKVALVLPKDNGDDLSRVSGSTRTIAVIMPNLDSIRPNAWETYLTTVDAVEALTGYDFFSNLPEPYQRCIEAGTNGNNPSLVKGDQTITFAQPADSTYGDAPFGVSATGGASGNPVTFVASGACSTSGFYGSTITVNNAGTCTVTASQAGSDLYNAAADVTRTFAVNRATPMFSGLSSPTIEAGTMLVTVGGVITRDAFAVQGGTVIITLNGTATAVVSDSNGQFSATLPTALLTVANSPYSLSFDYAGDANLTSATAASTVTVIDTTAPTIDAHANVSAEATSASGAEVTYTSPATHDGVDGNGVATCAPASGSVFALGTTTVTCTATDAAGNAAVSTTFTVTVADTTASTIDAHATVTAEATSASGASVTYTSPATHDAVDGDGVAICTPASGSVFALGATMVTCTATDAAGNAAVATTFTVTVVDTTAPTIDATANVSSQATSASGASVTYTSPATHDAVDGDGLAICAPASGSVFALGATTVTCTATDAAGNAAVATTFTVTVVDTTAPTIDPHANVIVSTTNPSGTAVTYVSPATHDAVSGNGVAVCAPISGSVFALGNTTVTCTASDAAGNAAVATTFTVIVGENRLGRFVVLGREQAWLREGSQVTTGDVGAASAIAAPRGRRDRDDDGESDRTVEVRFGENAKMLQAGSRVVGDTVWLRNRSQVFDVLYNELENRRGSILGSQTHPVALPYVAMPTALSVNAGTQSVSVAKNATLTLAPGSYGRVQVREKATLILTGGRYDFVSLDVDQNATVLFRAATDLRITTELDTDDKSKLIVDPSVSGLSAANVLITVLGGDIECRHEGHGSDGDDAGQTVAHIGEGNTITANIYAPNGTLWIRAKTVATGAFIGARVRIGERVALTLDSYYR